MKSLFLTSTNFAWRIKRLLFIKPLLNNFCYVIFLNVLSLQQFVQSSVKISDVENKRKQINPFSSKTVVIARLQPKEHGFLLNFILI